MRRKMAAVLLSISLISQILPVHAQEPLAVDYYSQPQKIRCTCYVGGTVTANGKTPFYGTIAGPEEWFGCAVAVYEVNEAGGCGEMIGWWEVNDTGPNELLQQGRAIDLWQPTLLDAQQWIAEHGDYVYIKLIRAEG